MKRHYSILILFSLFFLTCKEENISIDKDFPKVVTFNYNGDSVTYNVIKKEYYKDFRGNSISAPITKLWLDRNLGAQRAATVKNDSLASGDLFQWGRLADGHQKRNSETINELSTTTVPGHGKFIVEPLNSDDWLTVSNDSLWNDNQNTNCPCPKGWRVPTIEELGMEMHSWKSLNMDGAYDSILKWVSGGGRDNHGTERYSAYWAFIWSSTPELNRQSASSLSIIDIDTAEVFTTPRIYGLSVRCIKEY